MKTALALAMMLALHAGAAVAQTARPSPLQGTWVLAEADETKADGTRVQNYGADAQGLLIVDAQGRYSLQIFRAGRAPYAEGDKFKATAAEYAETVIGMSTHYGRVEVDAAGPALVFHIDQAAFPNWNGTVQRRRYQLVDGVLSYFVPPSADGRTARSVWRRAD